MPDSVSPPRTIIVTGGAGFIGSALVRHLVAHTAHEVVTLDKLTYAGDERALAEVAAHPRHHFERVDICDGEALRAAFVRREPDAVFHLAAESHVDRSIEAPAEFVQTNIAGTATLLDVIREWIDGPYAAARSDFRLVHVSTDEVYGSLPLESETRFDEGTAYDPHSPYAASKAASDHLVRAWAHTYGLPAILTHSTNNYGPWQYPEKLIPVVVLRALAGESIPVYGEGANVRDWMHVDDHVRALVAVLERGRLGRTYDIGARGELTNLSVVRDICWLLNELVPAGSGGSYERLITFVDDRPGHDLRYATDPGRAERELGWRAEIPWDEGLRATVQWFVDHRAWSVERLRRR